MGGETENDTLDMDSQIQVTIAIQEVNNRTDYRGCPQHPSCCCTVGSQFMVGRAVTFLFTWLQALCLVGIKGAVQNTDSG